MNDATSRPYPKLPEWVNITAASERTNQLMRQNWDLINQAADLLNSGDMSPLAWEKLQDLWAETIDLEGRYEVTRTVEFDGNHGDCGKK